MSKLVGTSPNQVPTNADLGSMAYQEADGYTGTVLQRGSFPDDSDQVNIFFKGEYMFYKVFIQYQMKNESNGGVARTNGFLNLYDKDTARQDNVEWNTKVMKASGTIEDTGYSTSGTWGQIFKYCDSNQLITGEFTVTGTTIGTRPSVMWDINYTYGAIGTTRAIGSCHCPGIGKGNYIGKLNINHDTISPSTESRMNGGSFIVVGYR